MLRNTMGGGGGVFDSVYFSVTKMYGPMLFALGVVQNCQHYQKRTQSTLICDPPASLPKEYFENVDFLTTLCENAIIIFFYH